MIAVMLDPDAAFRPARANAPAPPTPPVPAVVPHPEPVPAPEPALPRAEPWRVGVEAGAVFSLGLLPHLGTGFSVRGRLTPPGWPALELGGVVWLPGEASASGHGARLSLVEGLVSLCPLATTALGVALSACAGIRVGGIRAGGFGFNLAYAEERPTVAPSIEGGLRRRLVGPLVAGLAAGLVVPLIRDRFYYAEAGGVKLEVFRMSPLAGTLQATVGVELP